MDKVAVVLLQNPWSYHYEWVDGGWPIPPEFVAKKTVWSRRSWLYAFHSCRSGQRWSHVIDRDHDIWESGDDLAPAGPYRLWFDNTTPRTAGQSSGVHPPMLDYVSAMLMGQLLLPRMPDLVIACGKPAAKVALALWPGRLLVLPHPAMRTLTDDLMVQARALLLEDTFYRTELKQGRGHVERVELDEKGCVA